MTSAVTVQRLRREFKLRGRGGHDRKTLVALADVDLDIHQRELFGLLGPNGAGKTTLIKILCTLLLPTSGTAEVDGIDVVTESHRVRERINMVSGGEHSGYGILTLREHLWLFSQLYGIPTSVARERIEDMLGVLGLKEAADEKISTLSTGMRQKMNLIRGFVCDPKILFLDEPTLGLDVQVAREVRTIVRDWLARSPEKTTLLTTHYMAEAEALCDRVAIIDNGRVIACDSPENLKQLLNHEEVYHVETDLVLEPERSLPGRGRPAAVRCRAQVELRHHPVPGHHGSGRRGRRRDCAPGVSGQTGAHRHADGAVAGRRVPPPGRAETGR